MILITGAAGHIGSLITKCLSDSGRRIRLMTRDKNKIEKSYGFEIVEADYSFPKSLATAFDGIDSVFLVSGYDEPGKRALLHKNAIDAAVHAKVKHIVYLSFQGASSYSKFPMSKDHYQTEQYLKESRISYTSLRDNLYLDQVPEFFDENGVLKGPAKNGRAAWVSREDVAKVAASVLRYPEGHNVVYDITGPEALTMYETTERLSKLIGQNLSYKDETYDEAKRWRSQLNATDWEVETWLGSYEAIAAGELEKTSDTVLEITGEKPFGLEEYFQKYPKLLAPLQGDVKYSDI